MDHGTKVLSRLVLVRFMVYLDMDPNHIVIFFLILSEPQRDFWHGYPMCDIADGINSQYIMQIYYDKIQQWLIFGIEW